MKFINVEYGIDIELEENKTYEIVIENQLTLTGIVEEIKSLTEEEKETNFFICKNDKDLKFSKNVDIVLDYFSLMLNTKKVINKLYSNLELVADDYYEQKNDINSKMITVLDDIILAAGHEEVVFDLDFKWQDMFKIYGLKLDESYDNLVEKLSMYIKVLSEYTDVKVIFFVNIKSFLATEDLDKLYDMANYQKIIIILLESRESIERGREIRYIIDKDNCFIDGN